MGMLLSYASKILLVNTETSKEGFSHGALHRKKQQASLYVHC